jgi:phosphoglycerate dehydrogenase-like enzyme
MKKDTTVLFIWNVDPNLQDYLKNKLNHFSHVKLVFPSDGSLCNLKDLALKANIIVGWRPTKELLISAKNLDLVINPGAGVQHLIPLFRELSSSKEVLLANCHGNSYFVAQHAVALLLTLTNRVISHHNWMAKGEWRKGDEAVASFPLRTRVIGLLGYGAVNMKVHRYLANFTSRFAILRREWKTSPTKLPTSAKKYSKDELYPFLREINTLIIALPLTSQTKGLIGEKELQLLGEKGLLVNVARGQVVKEDALYEALKSNAIAGAAIDVWYNYRPDPDSEGRLYPFSKPFHELHNVVLSPHRAASPFNDLQRWDEVIDNIARYAKGARNLVNVVDLQNEY